MGKRGLRKGAEALRRLTSEIVVRKGRVARDLHGIGVRLRRIQREELWRDGGFVSFAAFLRGDVQISRASAYRFMRIADHFNAQIAERYGVEKLDAALRYMAVTGAQEEPGDVLALDIAVRDEEGQFRSRPLHEATAEEIVEAARALERSRVGRARAKVPASWRKRAARIEKRLPAAPKGTGGGKDRILLERGKDGRLAMTFRAVPVDEIAAFIAALREEL